jgi:UDP-glucose 4-epimerase
LVTGGAGFIGSHVTENLVESGYNVIVYDDFSSGKKNNLKSVMDEKNLRIVNDDLNQPSKLKQSLRDVKTVLHYAAYPEVRTGFADPVTAFKSNVVTTFNLLETIRRANVEKILFASSSVVYGEPSVIPTPETYGPLLPISQYGGSKLACEALISSYCYNYDIDGVIVRLANVIGVRSNHGIIFDFIKKLRKNNKQLKYLGSGKQTKSYLHIEDCVNGLLFCLQNYSNDVDVFNLGNDDRINVISIAKIVCKNMNLENTKIVPSGGTSDGRGWIGDVKLMQLDVSKLRRLGWKPKYSSKNAVDLASKELIKDS